MHGAAAVAVLQHDDDDDQGRIKTKSGLILQQWRP